MIQSQLRVIFNVNITIGAGSSASVAEVFLSDSSRCYFSTSLISDTEAPTFVRCTDDSLLTVSNLTLTNNTTAVGSPLLIDNHSSFKASSTVNVGTNHTGSGVFIQTSSQFVCNTLVSNSSTAGSGLFVDDGSTAHVHVSSTTNSNSDGISVQNGSVLVISGVATCNTNSDDGLTALASHVYLTDITSACSFNTNTGTGITVVSGSFNYDSNGAVLNANDNGGPGLRAEDGAIIRVGEPALLDGNGASVAGQGQLSLVAGVVATFASTLTLDNTLSNHGIQMSQSQLTVGTNVIITIAGGTSAILSEVFLDEGSSCHIAGDLTSDTEAPTFVRCNKNSSLSVTNLTLTNNVTAVTTPLLVENSSFFYAETTVSVGTNHTGTGVDVIQNSWFACNTLVSNEGTNGLKVNLGSTGYIRASSTTNTNTADGIFVGSGSKLIIANQVQSNNNGSDGLGARASNIFLVEIGGGALSEFNSNAVRGLNLSGGTFEFDSPSGAARLDLKLNGRAGMFMSHCIAKTTNPIDLDGNGASGDDDIYQRHRKYSRNLRRTRAHHGH
jgi:hypothetical protein